MVNATLVAELRKKTGAGFMDCKKALVETEGNVAKAIDFLRTKGIATANKKLDRIAAEGLTSVTIAEDKKTASIIELNAETDFVARNEEFQSLVQKISNLALNYKNLESVKNAIIDNISVSDLITQNIAKIGENINLRRMDNLTVEHGVIGHYVHNSVAPDKGKISVLVAVMSDSKNTEKLLELGHKLAVHIAANNPTSHTIEELDKNLVEHERNIFTEQAKQSGKPDNVVASMIEGRIRKLYEELVFLEQRFLFDDKMKISEVIESYAKELGSSITIPKFIRFGLGEGVILEEKKDFAAEVAAISGIN